MAARKRREKDFILLFFNNVNYSLQGYLRVVFFNKQEDEEVNVIGGE